jgi:acid phosphatase
MTASHGVTHPSQPNYLALWSGSTQGVTDNRCDANFGSRPSLGSQLLGARLSVRSYQEGLPSAGSLVCTSGSYARKHNPLADFDATKDAAHDVPFSAFPTDFSTLPTVSFVTPNLVNDMHDGSIAQGDAWLKSHLGAYATWAQTHNSLLIVTFDEDDRTSGNHIYTALVGQHVQQGATSAQPITHVNVLHTIEQAYGLSQLGGAAAPITGIWR